MWNFACWAFKWLWKRNVRVRYFIKELIQDACKINTLFQLGSKFWSISDFIVMTKFVRLSKWTIRAKCLINEFFQDTGKIVWHYRDVKLYIYICDIVSDSITTVQLYFKLCVLIEKSSFIIAKYFHPLFVSKDICSFSITKFAFWLKQREVWSQHPN